MNNLKFLFIFVLSVGSSLSMHSNSHYFLAQNIALNDKVYIRFGEKYVFGTVVSIEDKMLSGKPIKQYSVRWTNNAGLLVAGLINPAYLYKKKC